MQQWNALVAADEQRYFWKADKKKSLKHAKRKQSAQMQPAPLPQIYPRPIFLLPGPPPKPPMPVIFYPPQPVETVHQIPFPVPYRGTPKYNTKRRLTNPIIRRRSLSQSSICSGQSELYKVPQQIRQAPSISAPSPSPSSATICPSNASEYGTLRRYAPDAVHPAMAGFE